MRLGLLLLLVLCACRVSIYDPVDEIPHRTYADTASAVRAVVAHAGLAKVYAVGEYHPTRGSRGRHTPLAWFTTEIMALLVPRARHLVVEAWLDAGCDATGTAIQREVAMVTGRPPSTRTDLEVLVRASEQLQLATHGLPMTCIEHGALLDAMGRVDFLRLLELVTEKLGTTARTLVDDDRAVIVYGGALHNDLYPRWPLASLSYAHTLAADLGGGVVELDLVVPEVVAPLAMVRREPWFPLLGRAAPGRVLVWQRGVGSYVVILPAESEEVGAVARPIRRG